MIKSDFCFLHLHPKLPFAEAWPKVLVTPIYVNLIACLLALVYVEPTKNAPLTGLERNNRTPFICSAQFSLATVSTWQRGLVQRNVETKVIDPMSCEAEGWHV